MPHKSFESWPLEYTPGDLHYIVYSGPSMNPTLQEPDLLEIRPYDERPARPGDVIYFIPPGGGAAVVHRVLRQTSSGAQTHGDNNPQTDPWLLSEAQIKGRVVAAWREGQRRNISGGLNGQLISCLAAIWRIWRPWKKNITRHLATRLAPLYHSLADSGLLARWLPWWMRPRLAFFYTAGQPRLFLVWKSRIIGRYNLQCRQWIIQRPWRFFIDPCWLATAEFLDLSLPVAIDDLKI